MSTIYLYTEGSSFPGEVLLTSCLESRFKIRLMTAADQLLTQLEKCPAADPVLVILSISPAKITAMVQQIRSFQPAAYCIALINPEDQGDLDFYVQDCLFLSRPLNDFNVRSTVAAALKLASNRIHLATSSQLDEPSGLANVNYYLAQLNREIARCKRTGSSMACIIIGMGYYQMFLDSYGYTFVSSVLHHIGVECQKHIRLEDMVAKVGDQEVGLFLPGANAEGAEKLTRRILKNLIETPFHYLTIEEELSLFAGICEYPIADEDGVDADRLVRYARHALHQARQHEDPQDQVQLFGHLYRL